MLRDIRNCNQCGKDYEYGFMGAGTKYCSRKCRTVKNNGRSFLRYHSLKRKSRSCLVCDRDIQTVGKRKNIYKYCSIKCMQLHRRIKHGQQTITIKIPVKITVMKPVTIDVKDIPLIFAKKDDAHLERGSEYHIPQ
tara:strand:+ start:374 stop:781 length:408 start_codon:yes stop_codon:yes gene_type:complete